MGVQAISTRSELLSCRGARRLQEQRMEQRAVDRVGRRPCGLPQEQGRGRRARGVRCGDQKARPGNAAQLCERLLLVQANPEASRRPTGTTRVRHLVCAVLCKKIVGLEPADPSAPPDVRTFLWVELVDEAVMAEPGAVYNSAQALSRPQ